MSPQKMAFVALTEWLKENWPLLVGGIAPAFFRSKL